ncbi:O-antigen ligase family protein [Candidatus Wolfebacteria bacterium]|nr:O-antigen ligase family protein [Candidatus Wolfebacteria bacterium]
MQTINFFKISRFFIFIAPLAVAIVTPSTLFPFIVGKYVWFRTAVDLALIFFLLGLAFQDKLSVVGGQLLAALKSPLAVTVSIFVFIFILAGFFGVDPANSFWSNFERGEGGLQIIHLWLFFLLMTVLFREEKDWKKLFWFSIIGAVLMIFYGIAAGLGMPGYIGGAFGSEGFRFSGSIGNPAYVATYLIFAMFYAGYLLMARDGKKIISGGSLGIIGLIIFFFIFFWLAATRGGFMGLVLGVVLGGCYFAYSHKTWRKRPFAAVAVFAAMVVAMIYFKDTALVKSLPGSRIFDISFSATTWEHRTYMWKIAWDGFKERPLLGWGPENYINIFDQHFNIKYFKPTEGFGAWFDRAHSVYFDYLAETGILGLISYLAIFAAFYWQLFRNNKISPISGALLVAIPIAYLVQGLVLFEVLPLYLNLFLFLSFANYKLKNHEQ